MNRLSKSLASVLCSVLFVVSAGKGDHRCDYSPYFHHAIIGESSINIIDADQSIYGTFAEGGLSFSKCSAVQLDISAKAHYYHAQRFGFGKINKDIALNGVATTGINSFPLIAKGGLKIQSIILDVSLGRNICIPSENKRISDRSGEDCLCNHLHTGMAGIFIYDKFYASEINKTDKLWNKTVAKDLGLGIRSSARWTSESNKISIIPELSIYLQVWNNSKMHAHSGTPGGSKKSAIVKRSKYKPIVNIAIPVIFKFNSFGIMAKPSVIWIARYLDPKHTNDVKGTQGDIIENRAAIDLGVGISYSTR